MDLAWDEATGSISISLPANAKFPSVLTFGITKVVPQAHERYKLFPVKVGTGGKFEKSSDEESGSESDEESGEPRRRSKKVKINIFN